MYCFDSSEFRQFFNWHYVGCIGLRGSDGEAGLPGLQGRKGDRGDAGVAEGGVAGKLLYENLTVSLFSLLTKTKQTEAEFG